MPIGYRRYCHACFEQIRMSERIKRHRGTITPTPHSYAVAIQLRNLCQQLVESRSLIFQFNGPELMPDRGLEFAVTIWSATIIHRENSVSLPCEKLVKQSCCADPLIANQLCGWTAVNIHDQRYLGVAFAGRRQ